jgi:hypothetical protein
MTRNSTIILMFRSSELTEAFRGLTARANEIEAVMALIAYLLSKASPRSKICESACLSSRRND